MTESLMGVTEVADYLGVSRQRVHQLVRAGALPKPVAHLSAGLIWSRVDIEEWAASTGRVQSADSPQDNHQEPSPSTD